MDFSQFRDEKICKHYIDKIKQLNANEKVCFMEVCGTHTQAFFRYGLKSLLPENIGLISGPGCPVCVTPNERIDKIIAYSRNHDMIITTFGDLYRVPGSRSSLEKEKSKGANIHIVYSPIESIEIAESNPYKKIIFLGVGFETTTPSVAATLLEAKKRNLRNWFLFSANKLIPPAMKLIANSPDLDLDGFMCPGHVSTIIGTEPYEFIVNDYKIPCVITGFEPVDMLEGIYMLLRQHIEKNSEVEIQYRRVVRQEGNRKAVEMMYGVFTIADSVWRGLGNILQSGLTLKNEYKDFDIEKVMNITDLEPIKEPEGCICGEVLCGTKLPVDCKLFKKTCTPESPIGACMVSSEGTCAAYYKYS